MPLQTHPSFGGMSGEKHEDELAKACGNEVNNHTVPRYVFVCSKNALIQTM